MSAISSITVVEAGLVTDVSVHSVHHRDGTFSFELQSDAESIVYLHGGADVVLRMAGEIAAACRRAKAQGCTDRETGEALAERRAATRAFGERGDA